MVAATTLLASGCLSDAAYLKLSRNYALPAEYVDPRSYASTLETWTRVAPLGLAGGFAATLEDPAVGAAIISRDAQQSRSAGPPGSDARATWQVLYDDGDRLPIRVRWRFNRHLYDPAVVDPAAGWTFTLSDDQGYRYSPVDRSAETVMRDPTTWIGAFTLWFARKSIGGRLLITDHTRQLTLTIAGNPGVAEVTWRFWPLLDRPQYGLFDLFDSSGASSHRQPQVAPSPTPEPSPTATPSITL